MDVSTFHSSLSTPAHRIYAHGPAYRSNLPLDLLKNPVNRAPDHDPPDSPAPDLNGASRDIPCDCPSRFGSSRPGSYDGLGKQAGGVSKAKPLFYNRAPRIREPATRPAGRKQITSIRSYPLVLCRVALNLLKLASKIRFDPTEFLLKPLPFPPYLVQIDDGR